MFRRLAFTVAAIIAASTGTGACTSASTESPSQLDWKLCGSVECATLRVPLDWNEPQGDTISLHLSRHRAQLGAGRIGVLVMNPGGPGLPGTSMVSQAPAFLSPDIIRRFDVVSWDPRGTGSSEPQFQCDITKTLGQLDADTALETQRVAVQECISQNKRLFSHMSSADSARDLNALREALSESSITYFGYSYGSLLGATWSSLFPATVRALVLDAPPAINAIWHKENTLLATRVKLLWSNYVRTHKSLPASVDAQTIARAVVASVTTPEGRTQLENVLADTMDVNIRLRMLWNSYLYLTDTGPINAVAARYATQCSDQIKHTPITSVPAINYQNFTPPQLVVMNDYVCGLWPVSGKQISLKSSTAPALVLGGTHDEVTPLVNAQLMAKILPYATLLTVDSAQHTNYMKNECATKATDAFLIELATPKKSICR